MRAGLTAPESDTWRTMLELRPEDGGGDIWRTIMKLRPDDGNSSRNEARRHRRRAASANGASASRTPSGVRVISASN